MSLRLVTEEDCVTAYLGGEIDHHAAKSLREGIDNCAISQKPAKLLLNFREVTFMDSSGIGLVMGRYRPMQELGGELRVTGVPSHIRKVMRLSGLDKLAVMEPEGKRAPPPKKQAEQTEINQTGPNAGENQSQAPNAEEPIKTLTITVPVAPEELNLPPAKAGEIKKDDKEQQTVG